MINFYPNFDTSSTLFYSNLQRSKLLKELYSLDITLRQLQLSKFDIYFLQSQENQCHNYLMKFDYSILTSRNYITHLLPIYSKRIEHSKQPGFPILLFVGKLVTSLPLSNQVLHINENTNIYITASKCKLTKRWRLPSN